MSYEIITQIVRYITSCNTILVALDGVIQLGMQRKGLTFDNVECFAGAIETGVIKLPELQGQYQNLQDKVRTLQHNFQDIQYRKQGL
ncbi:MAG: hypothetical protein JO297_19485 [Nitrososphaeraceae archaeon]|nr:hypothetical protein [Nitrososphaeraceae archaeon]